MRMRASKVASRGLTQSLVSLNLNSSRHTPEDMWNNDYIIKNLDNLPTQYDCNSVFDIRLQYLENLIIIFVSENKEQILKTFNCRKNSEMR